MSYENQLVNMKQRILFMGLILAVMGIGLYFILTAEGIAPKKDSADQVVAENDQSAAVIQQSSTVEPTKSATDGD